jgi:hypothetical protein
MSQSGFEYQGFEEARAIAKRRHLRILLPVTVVLVILLALVCIAIYDYKTMRADALAFCKAGSKPKSPPIWRRYPGSFASHET